MELYRAFVHIPGATVQMIHNKRRTSVDDAFVERLQLAVTEVNGCAACSYAHAYRALRQGMSDEELQSFLLGEDEYVRPEEAKGILFAQHYADTRGFPEADAYRVIVEQYGDDAARTILAAVRLMNAGNMYGTPYSAFVSRLRGRPYRDSTLAYELGMHLAGFVFLPVAVVHGVVRSLLERV